MTEYYNDDSAIGRRYVDAVETTSRVATPLLSDVIGHLEKLITNCERLQAMLAVDLIEDVTSVPGKIHSSINTIVQKTQDTVEEFRSQIADKFIEYYEQYTDYPVTQLVKCAKYILMRHHFFLNIDVNDVDSLNISQIEKIIDCECTHCAECLEVYRDFGLGPLYEPRNENFSTKLLVDRVCHGLHLDLHLICSLKGFVNDSDYVEELVRSHKGYEETARKTLKCVQIYHTFLTELQEWLNGALSVNSSLPLQPADHRYILVELDHEITWLQSVSCAFAEKSTVRMSIKNDIP